MNFLEVIMKIKNHQFPELVAPGHHQFSIVQIVNYFPSALGIINFQKLKLGIPKIKIRNSKN